MATANVSGDGGGFNSWTTTVTNGYVYTTGGSITTPNIITSPPFAPVVNPFDDELLFPTISKGPSKLTKAQTERLLNEHRFIPMEGSNFCLFCYALDMYREAVDHTFVISEE